MSAGQRVAGRAEDGLDARLAQGPGEPSYPQNHVGRGRGTRNDAMGAVRLPNILVLTIDGFLSAQGAMGLLAKAMFLFLL